MNCVATTWQYFLYFNFYKGVAPMGLENHFCDGLKFINNLQAIDNQFTAKASL